MQSGISPSIFIVISVVVDGGEDDDVPFHITQADNNLVLLREFKFLTASQLMQFAVFS